MLMLSVDEEYFRMHFPQAEGFLLAAQLRMEAYRLALHHEQIPRLRELLTKAPACMEPWFVEKLKKECQKIEDILEELGI